MEGSWGWQWVQPYAAPSLNAVTAERCDASGNPDDVGASLAITADVTAFLQGGQLSLSIALDLACINGPVLDYTPLGAVTNHVRTLFTNKADPDYYYSLRITLSDGLSTITTGTEIEGGMAILDVLDGGKGVAFGMTAAREGVFEVGGRYKPAGDGVFETWTHTRTAGGVHNFEGHGICGKVWITAAYQPGDIFRVNGVAATAVWNNTYVTQLPVDRWVLVAYRQESARLCFVGGLAPFRQLLWSGTWSSGSIELPKIQDWAVIAVATAVGGTGLSVKRGDVFPVALQHVGIDNRIYSVTCVMNVSGNYLTFSTVGSNPSIWPKYYSHDTGGGHSALFATSITNIWGVLKG